MNNTSYFTYSFLIISLLIIMLFFILEYYPQLVFSAYIYMFVIAYTISFTITHHLKLSLMLTLLTILGRVIYRYNTNKVTLDNYKGVLNTTIFAVGMVLLFIASHLLKKQKDNLFIDITLYTILLYIVFSINEWIVHKYVMHCYQNLPWILLLPNNYANKACMSHKNHHLSVEKDMSLNDNNKDTELVFNLYHGLTLGVFVFILMTLIIYKLNLRINVYVNLLCCIVSSFMFVLVWNSIHTKMHKHEVNIPLSPLVNIAYVPDDNVYFKNHELHHQIKGDDKGNYNVVFLGADEFFNTNNKLATQD